MIFEHLLAAVSSAFLITVLLHTALKRDPHLFRLLRAIRHLRRGGSAFYRHPSGGSLKRVIFHTRSDPVS